MIYQINHLLFKFLILPFTIILSSIRIGKLIYMKYKLRIQLKIKHNELEQRKYVLKKFLTEITENKKTNLVTLTNEDLNSICKRLNNNEITSLDLLHAYQLKCLELIEQGNSGICEFIQEAENIAQSLSKNNSPINGINTYMNNNDLYGIPISLKEMCSVKGYDATFGFIKFCNQPMTEDCCLVKVLKQEGAIPFALSIMCFDTHNPIHGNIKNPYSASHEAGATSNGEAVLLARQGSPVGIGTDLLGSIRIPAAICGLTSLKPTAKRISSQGEAGFGDISYVILAISTGPMGRNVEDLCRVMRTLLRSSMFNLDPYIPPLPFNESLYQNLNNSKLHIGYYDNFEFASCVPSVRRVVHDSINYLEKLGHKITRFNPPRPEWAFELGYKSTITLAKYNSSHLLFGEPSNKYTMFINILQNLPYFLKFLLDKITNYFFGKSLSILRFLDGPRGEKNTLKLAHDIELYREEFYKSWLKSGNFDCIICPVLAFPALPIDAAPLFIVPLVAYCLLYTLLDYPAGTVPMGCVTKQDVQNAYEESLRTKHKKLYYEKLVLDLQSQSEGLPLSVQVVGKPWQEELVLRVMKELETCHRKNE